MDPDIEETMIRSSPSQDLLTPGGRSAFESTFRLGSDRVFPQTKPASTIPGSVDGIDERYAKAFAKIDARKSLKLNSAIARVAGTDADAAAKAQALGNQAGVGQEIAERNEAEIKARVSVLQMHRRDLLRTNPMLAEFIMNDPNFASVAYDDIDSLSTMGKILEISGLASYSRAVDTAGQGFYQGLLQREQMNLQFKQFEETATAEDELRIEKISEELENFPRLDGFLGSAGEIAGQVAGGAPVIALRGIEGAAVGAAPGVVAGVPGVAAGAIRGTGLGLILGATEEAFKQEAGNKYAEAIRNGFDKETAKQIALVYAIPSAGLEILGAKIVTAPYRIALRSAVATATIKSTEKLTTRLTEKAILKGATYHYLKSVFGETSTEVSQQVLSIAVDEIALRYAESDLKSRITTTEGLESILEEISDIAIKVSKGMAVLSVGGVGVHIASQNAVMNETDRTEWVFNEIANNTNESKLQKRDRNARERFIEAQTRNGNAETIYMKATDLVEVLRQNPITDAAMDELMPGVREKLVAANNAGGSLVGVDVTIPMSVYAARLSGTELGVALTDIMRLNPDAVSVKDLPARINAMKERAAEAASILANANKTDKEFVKSANVIEKLIVDQLVATGMSLDQAKTNARLMRDFVVVSAAKSKMTPEQFYEKNPLGVMRGEQAQGSFEQAQIAKMDSDYMAAVESGNVVEQQRMVDEATSSPGWYTAQHGTPTKQKISVFRNRGGLTGAESAKKAFFFSDRSGVTDTYRLFKRGVPNEKAINEWIDGLSPKELIRVLTRDVYFNRDKLNDAQEIEYVKERLKEEAGKFNEVEGTNYVIDEIIQNAKNSSVSFPSELDPKNIGQTLKVKLKITNPFYFTQEDAETFGIDAIVTKAIANGHDGIISRGRVADSIASPFDDKDPPSGIIYAVFNPEQIKSADPVTYDESGKVVPLSRRFNLSSPNILRQSEVQATFYSALSVEVGKSTTKSANAASWKQQIKGLIAKGIVKEREVYWSGLDNWLDLQEGKITKEQVQAFLDAGGVKVEITRLSDASKFSAYQQHGGTNYREILVTLTFTNKVFLGPHWDQRNVIVHLRLTDRVEADGTRVLFVEEVQSDWGQQGREKGFVNLTWKAALEKEGIKLTKESALKRDDALQALGSWRNKKWEGRPTPEMLDMIVSMSHLGDEWASRLGIESGDVVEQQRMVNEAAKAAMPNSVVTEPMQSTKEKLADKPMLPVYHGTSADFDVFERGRTGVSDYGFLGVVESPRHGIFFAENRDFAKTFAKSKGGTRVVKAFLNITNPFAFYHAQDIIESRNLGDEFTEDFNMAYWFHKLTDKWEAFDGDAGAAFVKWLEGKGYDGAVIQERGVGMDGEEDQHVWVALNPSQIKFADPVTYDESGKVVPLSRRFNLSSPNIFEQAQIAKMDSDYMAAVESDSDIAIINDYIQTAKRSVAVDRQLTEIDSHIPVAPFVETTSGWLELGLKQIMLEAVNGGYDRVAFINGEQSAARYDLSKTISEIHYSGTNLKVYGIDGEVIVSKTSVTAEELPDIIGKEATEKLLAQKPKGTLRSLLGLELKVGGEGIKAFYDKIVPQALSKMLKKLGGDKVENINVITEKPVTQEQINAAEKRKDFTEVERLTAIYERQQLGRGISEKGDQQVGEQQGFTIIPALAEQVSQGLPLFQSAQKGMRGSIDLNSGKVTLTEKSDLTTFAHELSHYFLFVTMNMASGPNATPEMIADANTLLSWFGVKDIATWNSMTIDQQRKYHEQFAYSFEIYLYEGKSPSVELQGVFERFRAWMTRVYVTIRDDLNEIYKKEFGVDLPILTGEVRQVMDRILASEDQITRQEAINDFKAGFQTQEESGMNDAEWAAYKAMEAEAHEVAVTDLTKASLAQLQWLDGAKSRLLASMQSAHKALRRAVRIQVADEIEKEPLYAAIKLLRTGKSYVKNGTFVELDSGNKLNLAELKKMIPTEDIAKLGFGKYGLVAEDGMTPDTVAEMFGFASGDELVLALLSAKPVEDEINARVDAKMLADHGDLNTKEQMDEAVNKALHNEARARFVAVELRFLAKSTKPVKTILEGAKQIARQIIGSKVIRSIKISEYTSAESRSAREATTAIRVPQSAEVASKSAYTRKYNEQIKSGVEESVAVAEATKEAAEAHERATKKIAEYKKEHAGESAEVIAIKAKQQQVIQNQLVAEAIATREEIEIALRGFRRFFKSDKAIAQMRSVDIVNAIRAILAMHGIGKSDKTAIDYMGKLKEYNLGVYESLVQLMGSSIRDAKNHRDLTVDEFRSLRDSVEALWSQAKRQNQIRVNDKLIQVDAAVQMLTDRVEEIGVPDTVPGERSAFTTKELAVRHLQQFRTFIRRVEDWADSMDGAAGVGAFTRIIFRPIKAAATAYKVERNKYIKQLVDIFKAVDFSSKKIAAPELNYTFGIGNGGSGKAELLGALMHSGNESNLRKLLLGRKWGMLNDDRTVDTTQWQKFINRMIIEGILTKKDFDFVQSVWDLTEQTKPIAQKAHHELFGYYFDEVKVTPIETPFGTYRGGYVPAGTDEMMVRDARQNAKMEELESDFRNSMPSTGYGFTKSRVEYNEPLSLDARMIAKHIDDVLRFSHIQPAIKDALKILKRKDFADTLSRLDPTIIEELLIPWLNRAAIQSINTPGRNKTIDKFWAGVRGRSGIAIMFANLRNALQQLTGFFPTNVKVDLKYMKPALVAYIKSPRETANSVAALSEFMNLRLDSQIFEFQETINELLTNPSKYERAQSFSRKHGYFLQTAFQHTVDIVTWVGAYNQSLANASSKMSEEIVQLEAVASADAAVRVTQGSMNPEDVSAYETGTPFYRTFTQFTPYFNMLINLSGTAYAKIFRDLGWRSNKFELFRIYLLTMALPAIVSDAIVKTLGTGWDDDDDDGYLDVFMDWLFVSQVRTVVAMVPFGSAIYTATTAGFTGKTYDDRITSNVSIGAIEAATIGTSKAIINVLDEDKELTGKNVKDVMTLVTLVTGIPFTAAGRPASYLIDVSRGEIEPTGPIDYVRGLVTGTASWESRR